jgi:glutamate-1-semialdehyde 2,1-aminomutase
MRSAQRPTPLVIDRAHGSRLWDVDGNSYVDYVLGFGPMLLGHSPKPVIDAVRRQLDRSLAIGAQHVGEAELAERLVESVPCAELVCLCTSGSEAVQAALRIARAATGRRQVVKFEGHYHGWLDPIAVATPGIPTAPPDMRAPLPATPMTGGQAPHDVLVCRWNDAAELAALLQEHGPDVAAVIMEPVACNGGVLEPDRGYLKQARDLAHAVGALLIFDEVVTGFRLALGGAQERYGVTPDLATFGKAIGGGLPLAAVAGSAAVMEAVATGRVRHVGTFNGSPVSVAAGIAAVSTYQDLAPELYEGLEQRALTLADGLRNAATEAGVPLHVHQGGSLLQALVASSDRVSRYDEVCSADSEALALFAESLHAQGVMVLPRGWWFLSAAHTDADIEATIAAARRSLASLAEALE